MMDLGSNKNIQKKNKLMTFSPLFNGPRVFYWGNIVLSGYLFLLSYRKLWTVYRALLHYLAGKGTQRSSVVIHHAVIFDTIIKSLSKYPHDNCYISIHVKSSHIRFFNGNESSSVQLWNSDSVQFLNIYSFVNKDIQIIVENLWT